MVKMKKIKIFDNTFVFVLTQDEASDIEIAEEEAMEQCLCECDRQEDPQCPAFVFNLTMPDRSELLVSIIDPTEDDGYEIGALAAFCTDISEIVYLMGYAESLPVGVLPELEAKYRGQKLLNTILKLRSQFASKIYSVQEYRKLDDIVSDPFTDKSSKVYKYNNRFYTKSAGTEFSVRRSQISECFLDEHCASLGTVKNLCKVYC